MRRRYPFLLGITLLFVAAIVGVRNLTGAGGRSSQATGIPSMERYERERFRSINIENAVGVIALIAGTVTICVVLRGIRKSTPRQ